MSKDYGKPTPGDSWLLNTLRGPNIKWRMAGECCHSRHFAPELNRVEPVGFEKTERARVHRLLPARPIEHLPVVGVKL
jgi:hypothetical protein